MRRFPLPFQGGGGGLERWELDSYTCLGSSANSGWVGCLGPLRNSIPLHLEDGFLVEMVALMHRPRVLFVRLAFRPLVRRHLARKNA